MTTLVLMMVSAVFSNQVDPVLIGRAELVSRNYSAALVQFDAALLEDPKNLEAVLGKVDSLCYMEKKDEAFAFAESVFLPESPEFIMVNIYKDLWERKNPEAKTKLQALILSEPSFYMAQYQLGWIYFREKNLDTAIDHLKKCIDLKSDFAPALYLIGDCYSKKNEVQQVIKYFEAYIEVVPPLGVRYKIVTDYLSKMKG